MDRPVQSRMTAFKVTIGDVVGGRFTKVEEEWQPSYLITLLGQKLSRVRLFGLVVNAYSPEGGEYSALTVDDGTGSIRLKAWREDVTRLAEAKAGDIVDVVGRIKEYNQEIYISPETVVAIDDPNFELMRKLEIVRERHKLRELRAAVMKAAAEFEDPLKLGEFLRDKYGVDDETISSILSSKETTEPTEAVAAAPAPAEAETDEEAKALVLSLIKKGGKDGLEYNELLKKAGSSTEQVDGAIRALIDDGEIFEPKSGRFRVLA